MPKKRSGSTKTNLIENFPITDSEQQVYKCELDPETRTTLLMYLYRDVRNVDQIRSNILGGLCKCVIIKPSLVLDPLQVAVAANRAVLSEKHNSMITRSVFTEILYNLSLTKNISQSLSQFGIEKDTDMLICFLVTPENDNSQEVLATIEGTACKIGSLSTLWDVAKIENVYKISGLQCDIDSQGLLDIIVSRMATKNIISH